jgi:hypothetical protein
MEWTDALRAYARMTGKKYHIPKKGTAEYEEVKELQKSGELHKRKEGRRIGAYTKAKDFTPEKITERRKAKIRIVEPGTLERRKKGIKLLDKEGKVKAIRVPKKEAPARHPSGRKVRSDKGAKRMTGRMIAEESVRQGLVSRAVALGRKVRSDKGKKRGARKAKMPAEMKEEEKKVDEMFYYQ